MPTLTATPYPVLGRVLVETSWGDTPSARCVQVRRVVTSTGATAPLRTYVWPCSEFGEYLHLSGGIATFWDTEAPLDEPFTYEADALDVNGNPVGEVIYPGSTGGASLPATLPGTVMTPDAAALDIVGDIDIRADLTLTLWANGFIRSLVAKANATGNQRSYWLRLEADGKLSLLWSAAGAAFAPTVSSTIPVPVATGRLAVRATLDVDNGGGNNVITFYTAPGVNGPWVQLGGAVTTVGVASLFVGTAPLEVGSVDNGSAANLLNGVVHAAAVLNGIGGTAVANPYFYAQPADTASFADDAGRTWTITAPARIVNDLPALVATAGPYTLASEDAFWLRDPLRPCNDRRLLLCFDNRDPECVPGEGIFFVEMAQETYPPNSVLLGPTNARRPIPVSRQRRDANSQLTVATRTFADRDAVLALNEPGSPLLFQAPPAYGVFDRYMAVDQVTVSRGLPDHTFQPRLVSMPYASVDRPVGPAQGVCGNRFDDICETYPTWTAAAASGLAWSTLVDGTAAALGFRTWGDTLADFGTWTNVLANGTWLQNRDD